MTLWIEVNQSSDGVATLLRQICPDPFLQIDLGPEIWNDPDSNPPDGGIPDSGVTVIGSGKVTYTRQSMSTPGCQMVSDLANARDYDVRIIGKGPAYSFGGRRIDTLGGAFDWVFFSIGTAGVVYLDSGNAGGDGYYAVDADGGRIPLPMDCILFHELAHARMYKTGGVFAYKNENKAAAEENDYRRARVPPLPERVGHDGGRNAPASTKSDCFVATAAYGSPLAPEVDFLRTVRDQVLRQTRFGSDWFDAFHERYYRFSPAVVSLMEADPEIRDLIRKVVVTPIIHQLELLLAFPEEPLDDVPEPWRGYLEELRAKLDRFTSIVEPPADFDGIPAEMAARELAIALRWLFRHPERRDDYLASLERSGALPLNLNEADRASLEILLEGRPDEEIRRILGPAAAARAFGDHHTDHQPDKPLYTVEITNSTGDVIPEIVCFYKRINQNGLVLLRAEFVEPGDITLFILGEGPLMESYVVGVYQRDQQGWYRAAAIPPSGNMTNQRAISEGHQSSLWTDHYELQP